MAINWVFLMAGIIGIALAIVQFAWRRDLIETEKKSWNIFLGVPKKKKEDSNRLKYSRMYTYGMGTIYLLAGLFFLWRAFF